jgi:D-inositol-3-phosphate glycosyltransferase
MRIALPYPQNAHPTVALGADYSSRRLIDNFRKFGSHLEFEISPSGFSGELTNPDAISHSGPRNGVAMLGSRPAPSGWDLLHDVRPAGDIRRHFQLRAATKSRFPIVQTHHALNYPFYLDSYFVPLLLAGSRPCDAVVCHSQASRHAFVNLLEICAEGVARSTGGRPPRFEGQLPIIPNGVDTELWQPRDRGRIRQEFALPGDAFVMLWLGRLSLATKADLLPLLLACAELRRRNPGREMFLVFVGTDTENYGKTLEACAGALGLEECIRVHRVTPQEAIHPWYSAADVFVSPVDNVQETFGNTLIEAMAAGVPQVVSDWNGYRDIVVHGETGFRVQTYWAACDDDAIAQWAVWGDARGSQGLLAQAVACNLGEMVSYLESLLHSRELRAAMGAASRKRAVAEFAWPVIVARYVECWMQLVERGRLETAANVQPEWIMPAFFRAFGGYASEVLTGTARLRAPRCGEHAGGDEPKEDAESARDSNKGLREVVSVVRGAAEYVMLDDVIAELAGDEYSATDLTRLVLRAIKYGLVAVVSEPRVEAPLATVGTPASVMSSST